MTQIMQVVVVMVREVACFLSSRTFFFVINNQINHINYRISHFVRKFSVKIRSLGIHKVLLNKPKIVEGSAIFITTQVYTPK